MRCGMNKKSYVIPDTNGRTIQTRLHPSMGEVEQGAIENYDNRRLKGEQARDIIATALFHLDDSIPAQFDNGTASWFLDRVEELNNSLVDTLLIEIGGLLDGLRMQAQSGNGYVSIETVEQSMSEFEKNLQESRKNRSKSFEL